MVDNQREKLNTAAVAKEKIESALERLESDIEEQMVKKKDLKSAQDKINAELHINSETLDEAETTRAGLEKQYTEVADESLNYNNDLENKKLSLGSKRREVRELGNEILKHKKKKDLDEVKVERERNACEDRLVDLADKVKKNQESIQGLGQSRDSGAEELDRIKSEERAAKKDLARLRRELDRTEEQLDTSRSAFSSVNLARFGPKFQALVQDIDSGRTVFKKKPIGPLGRHVKLSDLALKHPSIPDVLESFLGYDKFRSFLVDNGEDWKKLNELMRRHFAGQRPPTIFTSKFKSARDNISGGMVRSTDDIKTIMDYINVDDDNVFMHLVEWSRIESTLVITDEQAQHLFSRQENVPRNATKAITPTFNSYNPDSHRGNYSSYYIVRKPSTILAADRQSSVAKWEAKQDELRDKIRREEALLETFARREEKANEDIAGAKREIARLQGVIRDCLSKTQENKNRLHELAQDQNVERFIAQRAEREAEIVALTREMDGSKARKIKLSEEEGALKKKLDQVKEKIKQLRAEADRIK